jgi:hypothetical protein
MKDTISETRDTLLSKANRWLRQSLNKEDEGVESYDKQKGKIKAAGLMGSSSTLCALTCVTNDYSVQYKLSVTATDGGYTLALTDFVLTRSVNSEQGMKRVKIVSLNKEECPSSVNQIVWNNLKDDCYKNSQKLMLSFKEYMHSKAVYL